MDMYIDEHTHHIYSFGQPCLILLTSYMKVTYDNYNTIGINETLRTSLQLFYNCYIGFLCNYPTLNNNNNNNLSF